MPLAALNFSGVNDEKTRGNCTVAVGANDERTKGLSGIKRDRKRGYPVKPICF